MFSHAKEGLYNSTTKVDYFRNLVTYDFITYEEFKQKEEEYSA